MLIGKGILPHECKTIHRDGAVTPVDGAPAADFPTDDRGYGFDNIADVLTMSPLQLELYQQAAEALVEEALRDPTPPSVRRQYEAEGLTGTVGAASGSAWNLWSNGEVPVRFTPTGPGIFRLTVRVAVARGQRRRPDGGQTQRRGGAGVHRAQRRGVAGRVSA